MVSVPAGGTTGQALIKNSNTNHDIGWGTVSGGGGGGGREMLTANRTYYVRTDGNDGNDGLTNTAGGAFRTLQKGFDTIATLDLSTFVVTLKIADGTYTENSLTITSPVSSRYASSYIIEGNTTTYSNVVINSPGAAYSNAASGLFFLETNCQVKGVKVTAGYRGFTAQGACHVQLNGVEFGACGVEHVFSSCGSIIELLGANVISGSAVNHLSANNGGEIWGWLGSTTLVGTPDFSGWAFALAYSHGRMSFGTWGDYNFYGAATGPRFDVDSNSVVNLFGASGNSYFPGSTNGTTQRGGLIA